jgi:hypothetical protein
MYMLGPVPDEHQQMENNLTFACSIKCLFGINLFSVTYLPKAETRNSKIAYFPKAKKACLFAFLLKS